MANKKLITMSIEDLKDLIGNCHHCDEDGINIEIDGLVEAKNNTVRVSKEAFYRYGQWGRSHK